MTDHICACVQEQKSGQRQGGALTIKHTAARKGKGPTGGLKGPPGSDLEKKVLNCLSCGKVYDFRQAAAGQLSNDLLRFLGRRPCVALCKTALPAMAAATLGSLKDSMHATWHHDTCTECITTTVSKSTSHFTYHGTCGIFRIKGCTSLSVYAGGHITILLLQQRLSCS